jgi:serine/threonine-protein kinase CTR1
LLDRVDGRVEIALADFGSALSVRDVKTFTTLNMTPARAAPEWFLFRQTGMMNRSVNALKALDIYAFGLVLFEVLTLQSPWTGLSFVEIQDAVVQGKRPVFPASFDKKLSPIRRLIERCWNADPPLRPAISEAIPIVQSMISKQAQSKSSV